METLAPVTLKKRSALELFQMRQRIKEELSTNADAYEGREPTAAEVALEERGISNLKALDKVLEEVLREQGQREAFAPYDHLTAQHLSARDMAAVDWLKSAILDKNPRPFDIEPEEQRAFTMSQPALEYRSLWEARDTLTSTSGVAMPRSVWPNIMLHLVEQTPVLRAGAMLLNTQCRPG
jgi:hypothetical protein